jgi:hypothetical protein
MLVVVVVVVGIVVALLDAFDAPSVLFDEKRQLIHRRGRR